MAQRAGRFLAPPVFKDADKARTADLLNTMLWACLAGTVLLATLIPLISPDHLDRLLILVPLIPALASLQFIMRKGQVRLASLLVSGLIWFVLAVASFTGGGIRSPGFTLFIIPVIIASFLLGRRLGISMALLSGWFGLGFLLAERTGTTLPPLVPYASEALWAMYVTAFLLGALTLHLANRRFYESLARIRQSERSLEASVEKLQEQASVLHEREELYRSLFENNPLGLGITDEDGNIIATNEAMLAPGAYGLEDIMERKSMALFFADPALWNETWARACHQGFVDREEVRFRRKDGSHYDVILSLRPVKLHGRMHWQAMVEDISERKEASESLKVAQTRLEHLLSVSPAVIYSTGVTEDFPATFVSSNIRAQLGYDPQECVDEPGWWIDRLHPDDAPRVLAELPALFQNGQHVHEYRFRDKHGNYRWIYDQLTLVRNGGSNSHEIVGSWIDTTDRRQAETELRRTNELLAAIRDVQSKYIASDNAGAIFEHLLDHFLALTGSEYGFIGEVCDTDGGQPYLKTYAITNIAWNEETLAFYEKHRQRGMEFHNLETLFGSVIRSGEPVIANSPATDPRRGGLPDGHPPLNAFLGLPLYHGEQLVGMGGVANRAGGYDEALTSYLQPFLATCANLIEAYKSVQQRGKAENELQASETRYRAIVEGTSDVICRYLPDTTLTFVNEAYCRFYGQTRHTLMGHSFLQQVAAEMADPINEKLGRLLANPRDIVSEHLVTDAEGEARWQQWTDRPILDDAGNVVELQSIRRDITQHKRAQEEREGLLIRVRQRAAELTMLLDAARAVSSTLELEQVLKLIAEQLVVAIDAEGCALSRWDKTDDAVVTWLEIRRPGTGLIDPPGTVYRLSDFPTTRRVLQMGKPHAVYVDDPAADKAEVDLMKAINVTSLLMLPISAGGEVFGLVELDNAARPVREFTAEEIRLCQALVNQVAVAINNARLLRAIRDQAQQMETILRGVQEGIILLDEEHRVLQANPIGAQYLETLAEAEVGDVITRMGMRPLAPLLDSPPVEGKWHELALEPRRAFELAATHLKAGPQQGGWVLIVREVTEERERQAYLQAQERLATVGQLAAGVAHDFNNIMAVISLLSEITLGTPDLSPKNQERLTTIRQQADQAASLIGQILDFSRRSVMARSTFELVPFIREFVKLMGRTMPETISVRFHHEEGHYLVNADPARLQQALINLSVNARDAMPEGGELCVTLESLHLEPETKSPLPDMAPGEWLRLALADTGSGIEAEHMPHVFEPFFSTKPHGKGTGLGLAQVHGIIRQHGGCIDVCSEPGQGTTFTIYLPTQAIKSEPAADGLQEGEDLSPGCEETVLVVEDDDVTRMAVVDTLQILGYQVMEAVNGEDALGIMESHQEEIALILSDLVMPVMGGEALFQALQHAGIPTKMVMMTGYPLEEDGKALLEQGVVAWLSKPFTAKAVADVVHRALNR